jgi:hypothetical protein
MRSAQLFAKAGLWESSSGLEMAVGEVSEKATSQESARATRLPFPSQRPRVQHHNSLNLAITNPASAYRNHSKPHRYSPGPECPAATPLARSHRTGSLSASWLLVSNARGREGPYVRRANLGLCPLMPLISPPSMRSDAPVIHFAAGETMKPSSSAISSGCP